MSRKQIVKSKGNEPSMRVNRSRERLRQRLHVPAVDGSVKPADNSFEGPGNIFAGGPPIISFSSAQIAS